MESYSSPKKSKKISDLFLKYQNNLKPPQATIEKACVEAILNVTGHRIKPNMVNYNVATKTINFNLPSLLKTEIKIKQKEILLELNRVLGENQSPKNLI